MSDQYITLIASLPPHIPNLFATKQTPISRIKLDERLQNLDAEDAVALGIIEQLVHWDRMAVDTTNKEMIKRGLLAEAQLENEFIKDIVRWRLEERTFIAALRRRKSGKNAPSAKARWGYGRWLRQIETYWHEPAFGLELQFPWLLEANRLLREENYLGMERLVLKLVWDHYGRVVGAHYFDFEAVVVYVLRWDVIDRWSRYDSKKAEVRFNDMAASALGDYSRMFA